MTPRAKLTKGPQTEQEINSRHCPANQVQLSFCSSTCSSLFVATWISARARPIFDERYLAAALPPFLLLITVSAARMNSWIDTHLGWRWRFWVDGAAGAPSGQDSAAHRPTLLARLPIGRISAAALMILVVAANLYSLHNHYFNSRSSGWRALAVTLDRWSAGCAGR